MIGLSTPVRLDGSTTWSGTRHPVAGEVVVPVDAPQVAGVGALRVGVADLGRVVERRRVGELGEGRQRDALLAEAVDAAGRATRRRRRGRRARTGSPGVARVVVVDDVGRAVTLTFCQRCERYTHVVHASLTTDPQRRRWRGRATMETKGPGRRPSAGISVNDTTSMKEDEMGRTLRSAIGVTGLVVGAGLSFGAMSRAADEPPPVQFDEIQALIPTTEPVDVNVDQAGAEFTQIAALVTAAGPIELRRRERTHRAVWRARLLLR